MKSCLYDRKYLLFLETVYLIEILLTVQMFENYK